VRVARAAGVGAAGVALAGQTRRRKTHARARAPSGDDEEDLTLSPTP